MLNCTDYSFFPISIIFLCVYRIRQNFRGGKLSRLCTIAIHWKTFVVHQAVAIMYLHTASDSRGNFRDQLKNHKRFPTRKFCRLRYLIPYSVKNWLWKILQIIANSSKFQVTN